MRTSSRLSVSTSTTLLRQLAADSRHVRWGEFVRRYQPMMAEYLRVHFPGAEAEDIISETLVALVDALKNYRYSPDETGRFRSYLTGILKHKALYRRRMAERRKFGGTRKMGGGIVQYPIEALEVPVLHGRGKWGWRIVWSVISAARHLQTAADFVTE